MTVTNPVTSGNTETQGRGAARRRRATYDRRLVEARTDRDRFHALVWWWMSEVKARPQHEQKEARARMEAVAAKLNEGGAP